MALGTDNVPAVLRAMAGMRILYSETETKEKPEVRVDLVEQTDRHMWRIRAWEAAVRKGPFCDISGLWIVHYLL